MCQQIIDIHTFGTNNLHIWQVACRQLDVGIAVHEKDDRRFLDPQISQETDHLLRLRCGEVEAIDYLQQTFLGFQRQGRAKSGTTDLFGEFIGIIPWLWTQGDPAAPPQGRTSTPRPCTARPFLSPGFPPPPRTSPLVLVEAVPRRRLASCILTT